jgi:hypothetical protein
MVAGKAGAGDAGAGGPGAGGPGSAKRLPDQVALLKNFISAVAHRPLQTTFTSPPPPNKL